MREKKEKQKIFSPPESLDMETKDSWKSSDAKLFGARLLGLALFAVTPKNKIANII